MCMVSLYMLAILCCHTIDWDIFLRYWCLSQIYYYYYISHTVNIATKFKKNNLLFILKHLFACHTKIHNIIT